MKYDYVTLYNKSADFYNAHPIAKRLLIVGNLVLTLLFFACYGGLWAYTLLLAPLEIKELVKILFVPLLALLAVTVLRIAIDRKRPYTEAGAGITPLIKKKNAEGQSFPSRHLTCASVIAMTFLPFYPALGYALLGASVLLGYTRFALGVHYPSDLVAGWSLGICIGYLIFIL
jgi:membrane-associated phospholipid phosphatase